MKFLDKITEDKFLKHNLVFFMGSMIIAVLNYLYHPILGRMMSIEDFGEVQALIALFLQFGVVFGVFNMLTINITANIADKNKKAFVIMKMQKIAFALVAINFALIILFQNYLKNALSFTSVYPFISLALIYVFSVSYTFRKAFLQGIEDFRAVSISGIIFSAGRLVFAIILVMIGWRSFGAITALLIAQVLSFIYVYMKTRSELQVDKQQTESKIEKGYIKKELGYAFLVLVANGLITFLYTADVIMVKYLFSPVEAGLYGGVATIARIIFFATGSIAGVMLPAIKIKNADKDNFRVLFKSLWLVSIVGGVGMIIFMLFPELVIKLMIGSAYLPFAHLLGRLAILLFLASIVNLLFNYLMALRRYILIPISFIGIISIFSYIAIFGKELETIINAFIFGSVMILFILGLESVRKKFKHKTIINN